MGSVHCCSGSWCSSSVSSTVTPGWIWLMLQQARPHTTGTIASTHDTHITSLSRICCFWNENTSHTFSSHGLVIITKHLSTRRPSFPESLDLITPGNTPLFLQTLRNVGFWALLLQSQTLLWLVECRGGKKNAAKSQKANIIHRDALASLYIINNNNKMSQLFHIHSLLY